MAWENFFMNILSISTLIENVKQKLQTKFHDEILCTQYAWWLIEAITGKKEITLITTQEIKWSDDDQKELDEYLDNLINKDMPLQYLLGSTPFAELDILCRPPVLIPRPETEEWCMNLIEQLKPLRDQQLWILDLCTGSGCIALALADPLPKAKVYGTDSADSALALAQENAAHNHIPNATFLKSDLFGQIPKEFKFDLIVGNPPYIPQKDWATLDKSVSQWEDKNALIAEDDGLALIKKIIESAPAYLKKNETRATLHIPQLMLEIDHTQGKAVAEYMKQHGYTHIKIHKDLEGKDRVASGRVDNVAITQSSV